MSTLRLSRCFSIVVAGLLAFANGARGQSVFGVVEVSSWNACSSNLAACAQNASLPFMLANLNGMAGPMLRAPNLTGVDLQRPIRVYMLINTTQEEGLQPAYVTALPLSGNGSAYRGMLTNSFDVVKQSGSLLECSDAQEESFFAEDSLVMLMTNGVAMIGETAADVTAVAAALRTNGVPLIEKIPADIRAAFAMPRLLPLMEQGMAATRDAMQAAKNTTPGMPDAAQIVGCEMDVAMEILRQIQQAQLGIQFDASSLTLLTGIRAQPGSNLAAFLREQRPASERYTRILPANTICGMVGGGMASFNVIAKPYGEFMAKLYTGMDMADMGKMMQNMMTQCLGLYTGDFAIGVLPDARTNGLVLAEVFAISDPAKVAKLTKDMLAFYANACTNMPYDLSITSLPVRVYGGVEVQSYQYGLGKLSADQPMHVMEAMALMRPWLEHITIEMAMMGKDLVVTCGRAGAINQIMDRMRHGGDARFYQNTLAVFGKQVTPPTDIGHIELTGAIPALLPMFPSNLTANLPPLPPPGKGIGTCSTRQGDVSYGMLKITTSEISALMQTVPLITMSMQNAKPAKRPGGKKKNRPAPSAPQSAPAQSQER